MLKIVGKNFLENIPNHVPVENLTQGENYAKFLFKKENCLN
jgi:hypothetical protein